MQMPLVPALRRAFTLVELIVVLTILGLLAALGIVAFRATQDRAADGTAASEAHAASRLLFAHAAQNGRVRPTASDVQAAYAEERNSAAVDNGVGDFARLGTPSVFAGSQATGVAVLSRSGRCVLVRYVERSTSTVTTAPAGPLSRCDGATAAAGPAPAATLTFDDTFTGGQLIAAQVDSSGVRAVAPRAVLISNYNPYGAAEYGSMRALLGAAGIVDFTVNTSATSLADLSGYDLVLGDDTAWSCGASGQCGLLAQAYNAGYAVLTSANDSTSGTIPLIASQSAQTGYGLRPVGSHPVARGWSDEAQEGDTGWCARSVRAEVVVFAAHPASSAGAGDCLMAFGEDNPVSGGRWAHLQPYTAGKTTTSQYGILLARMATWVRPAVRTTAPIDLSALSTINWARVEVDGRIGPQDAVLVEYSVNSGPFSPVAADSTLPALIGQPGAGRNVVLRARISSTDPTRPARLTQLRLLAG